MFPLILAVLDGDSDRGVLDSQKRAVSTMVNILSSHVASMVQKIIVKL